VWFSVCVLLYIDVCGFLCVCCCTVTCVVFCVCCCTLMLMLCVHDAGPRNHEPCVKSMKTYVAHSQSMSGLFRAVVVHCILLPPALYDVPCVPLAGPFNIVTCCVNYT